MSVFVNSVEVKPAQTIHDSDLTQRRNLKPREMTPFQRVEAAYKKACNSPAAGAMAWGPKGMRSVGSDVLPGYWRGFASDFNGAATPDAKVQVATRWREKFEDVAGLTAQGGQHLAYIAANPQQAQVPPPPPPAVDPLQVIKDLAQRGISIGLVDGQIIARPAGLLRAGDRQTLTTHRDVIAAALQSTETF